ncbi:MAG: D-inositol-3-phosphate glycosyltransferase [Solirubrobacteraceae bacterium]|nr:D-inositol-3-phosphate glycosyltransferase [Solirubrobacteraceae bacterium]
MRRGSERLLHDLAVDLLALGHEPVLITGHPAPTTRRVQEGFEVVRLRRGRLRPLAVRRELRDADVAVAAYPTEVPRRPGCPVVFAAMGLAAGPPAPVVRQAAARADVVTALSETASASIVRWLGVDPVVIRPGVDLGHFSPGGTRAAQPTIACAADPGEPRKRVAELVAALPDVRLLLMGPPQPELAAPHVEFVDPAAPVRDLYREAWVTGLASVEEAFGLVLVESLACGTPVFARDDGGGTEIVTPETGALFSDDLAGALRRALALAADPATAAACRARAEAFPSRATAEAYVELFTRVRSG